ncbi:MAG: EAL domain-containing protein [Gammaproteobacteria bacterium]|nr:EAL domain-containing protein [Gammaproteobacteria bacterium]
MNPQHIDILVIDDSATDAETYADLLRKHGYDVSVKGVYSDAPLQLPTRNSSFDLLLYTPEHSKKTFQQVLAFREQELPYTPLIVIQKTYHRDQALNYVQDGADEVFSSDELGSLAEHLNILASRSHLVKEALFNREMARQTEINLRILADAIDQAVAVLHQGNIVYANQQFHRLLDHPELTSLPILDLVPAESLKTMKSAITKIEKDSNQTTQHIDTCLQHSDGNIITVRLSLRPIRFEEEASVLLLVESDTSRADHRPKSSSAESAAETDNIEFFLEETQRAISLAKQKTEENCLCFIEIDDFQASKESLGIKSSNHLQLQCAHILSKNLPAPHRITYLGSSVFLILLRQTDSEFAEQLAEKLCAAIAKKPFNTERGKISLTCSMGVVAITEHIDNIDQLISYAQTACQVAYRNGGNGVHVFDHYHDYDTSQNSDIEWKHRIETAINQNEFRLFFQPIKALKNRFHFDRYDVFIRLIENDEEVQTTQFLHAARQCGIEHQIDKWVIINAFQTLQSHKDSEHPIQLFVKISLASILDSTFPVWLQSIQETFDIGKHQVALEFDADTCKQYLPRLRNLLPEMKKLGFETCIEHYGKSVDHLTLLDSLSFDYVKIDGSLITNILHDRRNQQTIKKIIIQCDSAKATVIAVSVQDASSVSFLWQAGIGHIQGFYIQQPQATLSYDFKSAI